MFEVKDTFAPAGGGVIDDFPEVLTYEDVRAWLWNSSESEYLLGVDAARGPVTVDLASDTPHVMISAGSGAGKSVMARSIATQALVKGGAVYFLDVKRISHRWAKNLPGVGIYASEIHRIADVLNSAAAEVMHRMQIIEDFPGPVEEAPVGERCIIIAEELNSMMEELREFEKSLPSKGTLKPSRAFGIIMNLGRAAKIHVVGMGQYVDGTVIPKRWKESFGYKCLAKHTPDSWRMFAWNMGTPPPAPQHKGRGYVVTGERAIQTQYLFLSEEECAELVRTAYEARERMGLVPPNRTRREERAQRQQLRALGG